MPQTLSPQPIAKKTIVLRPDDAVKETLRRRNLGRPCPHCHMPLTMGHYVTGDRRLQYPQFAYYQCKGYRDPETDRRYAGCGGSFKLRVMTEAEQLTLLKAGRYAELEDYLRSIDRTSSQKKLDDLAAEHLARLTAGKDGATLAGSSAVDETPEPELVADAAEIEPPQYELQDSKPARGRKAKA